MKKILFSVLSLAMLAGPVSQAHAYDYDLSQIDYKHVALVVGCAACVAGAVCAFTEGPEVLSSSCEEGWALKNAQRFLDGSCNASSALLLKVIKESRGDVPKTVERVLKHFNGHKYFAIVAADSLDKLRSDLSQFEQRLSGLLHRLWFSCSKRKFRSCIAELAQAREFVGSVIGALKVSGYYETQYETQIAEQKADGREHHNDKVELIKAATTSQKSTIYTDVKPAPIINLTS